LPGAPFKRLYRVLNREIIMSKKDNKEDPDYSEALAREIDEFSKKYKNSDGSYERELVEAFKKTPLQDIEELLYRAYRYDDKPHRLYSYLRLLAVKYEEGKYFREEVVRLMDIEYYRDRSKRKKK
jgi:hypothetical protein